MPRLFVFAIGGSGSRVLKSLTMLLASGVKPRTSTEWEIVPMVLDPHLQNLDVGRTHSLLRKYQAITDVSKTVGEKDSFFSTKVTTLGNLADTNRDSPAFHLALDGVTTKKFGDYIGANFLNRENKALAELLFSGSSHDQFGSKIPLMDVEMDIGFVGNPNIGAVVLNQFSESEEFRAIGNIFGPEDRVFIISSIFGGTGAAGFPIVLKNLRNADQNPGIANGGFIKQSKIGALTICPYFNIEADENDAIKRSHFIQKTRSALQYYSANVTSDLNRLYYLADMDPGRPIKNDAGHNGQQNPAHFIELAGALSIIDFLEQDDTALMDVNGAFKEFSIRNDSSMLKFEDLENHTIGQIKRKMSQMFLFWRLSSRNINDLLESPWARNAPEVDSNFFNAPFFRSTVVDFLNGYKSWIAEMSSTQRGFVPFNIDAEIENFINEPQQRSGWFSSPPKETDLFTSLNRAAVRDGGYSSLEEKLIKSVAIGTKEFLDKKFSLK